MSLVRTRRMMFQYLWVVVIFVAIFIVGIFLSFNYSGGGGGGPVRTDDGLFAKIGGETVTQAEFERELNQTREQFRNFGSFGQQVTLQQMSEAPRYAYERLLQEYAEAAAARAARVDVPESEARTALNQQIEQVLATTGKGASKQELAEFRAAMSANMDVEGERRRLMGQRLRETLAKSARPVEVKVAHVLVKTQGRTDDAALRLAQDVARRARAGEDFAALAKKHSEDPGSKERGGEVGWASAMPAPPDPSGKPNPDAATSFVPEFTAAALQLKPNQISDPVRSTFGYHVLKALSEREYQPTGAEEKKDPKKRQEAVEQYRQAVGSQIANGMISAARARLAVEPHSPWLKGFLKEQEANAEPPVPVKDKPAPAASAKLTEAVANYEEALKSSSAVADQGLAFKLVELYRKTNQPEKALPVLDKWAKRSSDPEMYFAKGEIHEKLKDKKAALEAYQQALDKAWNNPTVLGKLQDRFKELGRGDLAQQAKEKQGEQLARQAAQEKQRQEQFRKMMEEQTKKAAAEKPATGGKTGDAKPASGTTATDGATVGEITVKTGDIDPKTGKPKIISVTPGGAAGDEKSEKAGTEGKPAAPATGTPATGTPSGGAAPGSGAPAATPPGARP